MISEQKFRVETPYGVKIFQFFHFQKHAPIIPKKWVKKNFQNSNLTLSLKKSFLDYLPKAKRALAKGLGEQDNVTTAEDIALPYGEVVMLGDGLREYYDVWECNADEDEMCNGLYLAASAVSMNIVVVVVVVDVVVVVVVVVDVVVVVVVVVALRCLCC